MKKKIFSFLLHPLIISILTTFVIVYFLPTYFTRYSLEIDEQSFIDGNAEVYFPDLDGNGNSERLRNITDKTSNSSFILFRSDNTLIDQWTFSDEISKKYWFYDSDNNGYQEIYFLTQKTDSVFINVIEPIQGNGDFIKKKERYFLDTIAKDPKYNKYLVSSYTYNGFFSRNKKEDVVLNFCLGTGYGGYPRKAYSFNTSTHNIKQSSHLTNLSKLNSVERINNENYLFFLNYSYGNELDTIYTKKSDYSLWLNVLNEDLQYLFEPIELKVPFSELKSFSFKRNNQEFIIAHLHSRNKEISASKLIVYDINGKEIQEKTLGVDHHQLFKNLKEDGFYLHNKNTGILEFLNLELETIDNVALGLNTELQSIDLNDDGLKNWFTTSQNRSSFTIYNNNFKEGLTYNFPDFDKTRFFFGVKRNLNGNQLYVQNGDYYYFFNYKKNSFYFFKIIGYYFLVFTVVYLFIYLINKGQKLRTEKRRAVEKEISELQLKTVNNQLNPHFVFNAINSISEMMLTDNKLEADKFICRFSDLMRQTLKQSDKISATLKEELDYVENFIQLQQMRFQNQFKYEISISKNVDTKINVPKHVIYSYVENAIKHGLAKKKDGFLKITITQLNELQITIEDNGEGIHTTKTSFRNSTGNGIKIMEKVYELYTKLYKKKIHHIIKNIISEENTIKGVRVVVVIS